MRLAGRSQPLTAHNAAEPARRIVADRRKRAFDVLVAALGLTLCAPLLLLVAVAIKLDSRGPIIFRAQRVGLHRRPLTMYKFRTMRVDAEARLAELAHLNRGAPYLIKIPHDPRVTRVGRFLRKTSLDELPQLFNVLRGEMSMVGPRPQCEPEGVPYSPAELRRLAILPGITGLWQVEARADPRFARMVEIDCRYIDSWSFFGDMRIVLRTFGAVLRGSGGAVDD